MLCRGPLAMSTRSHRLAAVEVTDEEIRATRDAAGAILKDMHYARRAPAAYHEAEASDFAGRRGSGRTGTSSLLPKCREGSRLCRVSLRLSSAGGGCHMMPHACGMRRASLRPVTVAPDRWSLSCSLGMLPRRTARWIYFSRRWPSTSGSCGRLRTRRFHRDLQVRGDPRATLEPSQLCLMPDGPVILISLMRGWAVDMSAKPYGGAASAPEEVLVTTDLENAYGRAYRSCILRSAQRRAPELVRMLACQWGHVASQIWGSAS